MAINASYTAYTPNLAPSINPNPKPIVKLGHAVLGDADGLNNVFSLLTPAIEVISAITPSVPACLPILGSLVKSASGVIKPFQFFKVAKDWTEISKKTWAGRASLVGITALTAIGLGRFLEKIQLFNMTAAVSKLGNVPVLGSVVQLPFGVLAASVSVFSAVDAGIKLRKELKAKGEHDTAKNKLNKWQTRQAAVAAFNKDMYAEESAKKGFTAIPNWAATCLGVGYSKKADQVAQAINQAYNESADKANETSRTAQTARQENLERKTRFLLDSPPSLAADSPDAMNAVNAYTAYKVRHWRAKLDNSKVESKKALFSLVSEISKFALVVLGIVGASLSIAALAISSLPMLTLGLIVAGIALAKKVYDTNHKERLVPNHPDTFEAAVVAKYRQLKEDYKLANTTQTV